MQCSPTVRNDSLQRLAARHRFLLLSTFALAVTAACGTGGVLLPRLAPEDVGDTTGLAARGRYIVRNVAVCGQCHAERPQNPDGPLSGGFAFRNWRTGTIRAANLTPDSATGLGLWSDAEIVRALRAGEGREGDLLAPIMPYAWFHDMSDRDALAVARYLRRLEPVHNDVDRDPNLLFHIADFLFLKPVNGNAYAIAPAPGLTVEYGGYLAENVGLCAECHTPRHGLFASPDRNRLFAGEDEPPKDFPANPSNITPDTLTGIGKWTEEDFLRTMRTGVNPQGDTLNPFMPWKQLSRMSDDDLRAIYRYLRTVPAQRNEVPRK